MSLEPRALPRRAYEGLKAVTRRLYKKIGGLEAAETLTRFDHSTHGRFQNVNADQFLPIDVLADLEHELGEPVVTKRLAEMQGYILIAKLPTDGVSTDWARDLGALAKEGGEAIARLGEAFAVGGEITAEEIERFGLLKEVGDVMEVAARIDQLLRAIVAAEHDKEV